MTQSVSVAPRRVTKLHAAMRLGVNRSVLESLIKAGSLEVIDIPGMRTTILESSLEALIERMSKRPSQKNAG